MMIVEKPSLFYSCRFLPQLIHDLIYQFVHELFNKRFCFTLVKNFVNFCGIVVILRAVPTDQQPATFHEYGILMYHT